MRSRRYEMWSVAKQGRIEEVQCVSCSYIRCVCPPCITTICVTVLETVGYLADGQSHRRHVTSLITRHCRVSAL